MVWRWLALVLALFPLWSEAQPVQFRPLGVAHGLEVKVATSLIVDHNGFLWVASREGLYRYDGYAVKAFLPSSEHNNALPDADVRALFEDRDGYIWVATNTAGLSRYDPRSGNFRHFRHRATDPITLSHDSIYGMAQDGDGMVWAGSQIGLNRLNPENGKVQRFLHDPADPQSLSQDYVYDVLADGGERIWVATLGGGVDLWQRGHSGFAHFDLAKLTAGADALNSVFALARRGAHSLYAGTRQGLVHVDTATGRADIVPIGPSDEVQPTVTAMAWGPRERLWMTTMGRGVLVFDPASGDIVQANPQPLGAEDQLPALPQLSLYISGDSVFVGTWGNGVYLARLQQHQYTLVASGENSGGLLHHNVTAILAPAAADDGWIGTFGGGLQPLEHENTRAGQLPGREDALWKDGILAIARRGDGSLLAGSNHGLWTLNADGSERRLIDADSGMGLGPGYVTSLLEDSSGALWVGVGGSGLYHLPAGKGRFESFAHDPERPDSLSGNYISTLLALDGGRLLVGTRSSGLNLCTTNPWRCQRFGRTEGLGHHNVTGLHQGARGHIWVGTDGGGLHELVADGDQLNLVHRWTQRDGLLSDSVMGIVEDDDGSLWLSTRQGLSRLQPRSGAVINHVAESGLPVTHFNSRTATRDRASLYFGGLGGMVKIPAGTPMIPREPSPVRLVDLSRAARGDAITTRSAAALTAVHSNWGEMLSFTFAALDFAQGRHEYQYRLANDEAWRPLGSRRELTLLELSPGNHQLSVRGRDVFGSWGQSPPLQLDVVPPWWMTNWFRSAAVVILILLVSALHHYRLRGLRRRNAELEELRRQKEAALEQAESSREDLADAHAGLRHLTARLHSAREDQRQQIARELHDELGQTLTAAKINLQRVARAANDSGQQGRLRESVSMLDSMIRQVRNISLSLRPPLLDEAGLVEALKVFLRSLGDRAEVKMDFQADSGFDDVSSDVRTVAFRLVQEAVNNVLRHAGASQIVVRLRRLDNALHLYIEDDGCGFESADVWQRVKRGEHLGLLGMQERVHSFGGTLSLDAFPGSGSRVTAVIPI
ncbi:sensor histidine kinase [Microbulbifer hainanensis]|uniref:sensor histidine kinase n=1 Tax=Microbulbifer hainanensis TaxID=2735675 RepID=UPI001865DCA2|nr:two-component regulator propeller domain-containing protein [Microbulbifer hainanensis]